MSSNKKTLRVGILRLRCQEPQRYYIALQCPHSGSKTSASTISLKSIRHDQTARTETSEPSRNPDFACSSFLLRLPAPLAVLPPEQPLLRLDLFSAPGLEPSGGIDVESGGLAGRLVASGLVAGTSLGADATSRLLQGQRVTLTLALTADAASASASALLGDLGNGLEAASASNDLGKVVVSSLSGLGAGLSAHEVLLELELLGALQGAELLEALVQECLVKQAAMSQVARQLDSTTCKAEELSWRLVDAEKRSRNLVADNERLQQLLQTEQQAWRIPQLRMLVNSAMLSRDELIERCESVMAAYGRERARNGDLVERLRVLHSEQVDALELKKRYQQLQEAHEEQARAYADLEGESMKVAQLRATVKTQEEIIHNLEALLAQAVQKVKPRAPVTAQNIGASNPHPPAATADIEAGAAAVSGEMIDLRTPADLRAQLEASEQRLLQLQDELAVQQAAAQEKDQQIQRMEAELETLRQHTVTEFPAVDMEAAEAGEGPRQERPGTSAGQRLESRGEKGGGAVTGKRQEDAGDRAQGDELLEELGVEMQQPLGKQEKEDDGGVTPGSESEARRGTEEDQAKKTGPATSEEAEATDERLQQLQERIQSLESELVAARERIRELSESEEEVSREMRNLLSAAAEVRKLQLELAQLTEERTASQLRAEYAEGAAEAAQSELAEVTRKCAREIAALKTRLAEKDAAMMGGFGGLEQLSTRSEPPFPAFPPPPALPSSQSAVPSPTGPAAAPAPLSDARSGPAPLAALGTEANGSGSERRAGVRQAGLSRLTSLAHVPGIGADDGQAQHMHGQAPGLTAAEAAAGGPRALMWMKSRRGRMSMKPVSSVPPTEG
ncbi:hypothetical protein VOLCADRAFT_94413 [Volvox carteri f. nagariensis]|uniref:Uncharacterized protein n=1 Tax=Volvox carteri f. nagariensis TaxID=3068 RepID=D8U4Q7_VOLCA|nr:uncharacterized protein VOLCADRAFT_94413 [Volvox carteri f. nagariensis]EFJ45230.1 hypothetical protein VOLCADRAFT_94413 [Volvox carteri f. nagariensis]|eukprot:XP_002953606.1 hypothetical protein VOLCADRAFT_94413 [Volvox carteri f. nagariensis]